MLSRSHHEQTSLLSTCHVLVSLYCRNKVGRSTCLLFYAQCHTYRMYEYILVTKTTFPAPFVFHLPLAVQQLFVWNRESTVVERRHLYLSATFLDFTPETLAPFSWFHQLFSLFSLPAFLFFSPSFHHPSFFFSTVYLSTVVVPHLLSLNPPFLLPSFLVSFP